MRDSKTRTNVMHACVRACSFFSFLQGAVFTWFARLECRFGSALLSSAGVFSPSIVLCLLWLRRFFNTIQRFNSSCSQGHLFLPMHSLALGIDLCASPHQRQVSSLAATRQYQRWQTRVVLRLSWASSKKIETRLTDFPKIPVQNEPVNRFFLAGGSISWASVKKIGNWLTKPINLFFWPVLNSIRVIPHGAH